MRYQSDLSDREWEAIRHHFEYKNGYGNRRKHPIREVLNAIFYVNKTGCQWRQLPKDFPHWKTVYSYYRRLCKRGTWEKVLDELNRMDREKSNRSSSPSYIIVDSQSVKTCYRGSEQGFDGEKKVKGRKRHIGVDTQGRLYDVVVTAANVHDTNAGVELLDGVTMKHPSIQEVSADSAYRGNASDYAECLLKLTVHITQKSNEGFRVLTKRWIVERTFAWLG